MIILISNIIFHNGMHSLRYKYLSIQFKCVHIYCNFDFNFEPIKFLFFKLQLSFNYDYLKII